MLLTRLAVVKTDSPNYTWRWLKRTYLTSTSHLHAWRSSKPTPTWWRSSPNFYKHPTRSTVVKTNSPRSHPSVWQSKNGLSKLLQGLGGGQNGLSELLQASCTLGGGQNGVSQFLQAWLWPKQSLRTSKKPPTRLAVAEMDFPYFC